MDLCCISNISNHTQCIKVTFSFFVCALTHILQCVSHAWAWQTGWLC